jgi:DNA helicase II / ATP-dependent DNA helicase PcrA
VKNSLIKNQHQNFSSEKRPETEDLFQHLNPQQIEAVKHTTGPALVVAGPGSGKTRVLTHRIAYLMSEYNVPEINILCVTFTNKAAKEIKERVARLIGAEVKLSWGGTFHSVCARILRIDGKHVGIPNSFVIYDTDDQTSLIKGIVKDFGIDSKKFSPNSILKAISGAKSELVEPQEFARYAQGYFKKTVALVFPEYQKRLRANNAVDFDDLLNETVRLFQTVPEILEKYNRIFKFVLIDEYQDTNKSQYVLTKLVSNNNRNLFVVGDMSQAIYSFRGADFRNILNFQRDYPDAKIYNLEQNYRSTQNILDAAKKVIVKNSSHIPLDLWTANGEGEKLCFYTGSNERDEANFVVENTLDELVRGLRYKDIAVLYRTNAQSRNIEEHLIKAGIPYKIVGGLRFYSRREVKDIIAYLRVVCNPKDSVSWERIINVPTRGIGDKGVQALKEAQWDLDVVTQRTGIPFKTWIEKKSEWSTLELMEEILQATKYLAWLDDKSEDAEQRIENIKELKTVAAKFINLDEFLENVALIESSDRVEPDQYDSVTLMTVHASKGLEFKTVFIVGLEEGLFPHSQSMESIEDLEEERRLCYVAITRAMERVFLTNTNSRMYFGSIQMNLPSRFVGEIPEKLLDFKGFSGRVSSKDKFSSRNGRGGFGGSTRSTDEFLDEIEFDRNNFSWD